MTLRESAKGFQSHLRSSNLSKNCYHEFVFPQNIHPKHLLNSALHMNARSACNKEESITSFLDLFSFKFDIIMITETWYHDDYNMLHINGYNSFYINRPEQTGGCVALYVNLDQIGRAHV